MALLEHHRVDPCLFKVVCLIEISSKFIQEKNSVHIFAISLFLSVWVN